MKNIFILIFVLVSTIGFAQTSKPTNAPNELDEKYTPNNERGIYTNKKSGGEEITVKNIFTYDVGLLARSIVAVNYERVVAQRVSIIAGIGLTFAKDGIQKNFMTSNNVAITNFIDHDNNLGNVIESTNGQQAGIYASAGARMYRHSSRRGVFLQPCISFAQYGLFIDRAAFSNNYYGGGNYGNNSSYWTGTTKESIKNLSLNINVGWQFATGTKKMRFVHNLYVGFGIKSIWYKAINYIDNDTYDPNTGIETYSISARLESGTSNNVVPVYSFGYCLGLGF